MTIMPNRRYQFPIIYLRKLLGYCSYNQNPVSQSMSEDPEQGQNPTEETELATTAQRKRCYSNEALKSVVCIILVMIPLVLFVVILGVIGASSEPVYGNGRTNEDTPATKIVGGTVTEKGKFPHQILLLYKDRGICGGSLLTPSVVITSAHCLEMSEDAANYKIVAGEHNLKIEEGTEQTKQVEQIKIHPQYDSFHKINDVTLLFLTENVTINSYVSTIEISQQTVPPAGVLGTVVGWGVKSEKSNGQPFEMLQEVQVPILSESQCQDIYGESVASDGSAICAGYSEGKKDACQADSGGPLLIDEGTGKLTLIGIVSWGEGCGREGYPGIYANAPFFTDWIRQTINEFN